MVADFSILVSAQGSLVLGLGLKGLGPGLDNNMKIKVHPSLSLAVYSNFFISSVFVFRNLSS